MIVLIGFTHPGSIRARIRWGMKAAALAGAYGLLLWYLGLDFAGYDNPMMSHSGDMLIQWPPVWTREWSTLDTFYSAFLKPLHFLAFLSPLTLLPGIGALFFHLTAPAHGGVDTAWSGHIHHMAPIVGFVIAATIQGAGQLVRWSSHLRIAQRPVLVIGALAGIGATIALAKPWMSYLELEPGMTLRTPAEIAPEWEMIAGIPGDASVATDTHASLIIANRKHAYTYDESLADKRPGEGLSALDFIMVRKSHKSWIKTIQAAKGQAVDESKTYVLYDLR